MSTKDEMKEKLSALVDNELNELVERRMVAALVENQELRGTWERYHLIRAAVREELTFVVKPGFSDRVVGKINDTGHRNGMGRQTVRVAGALAIAASVAAVAIVGLQQLQSPASSPAALATLPPASPLTGQVARANGSYWDAAQPEAENTLNTYLIEHNEFSPASGIGGMLPYVRIVGYDASSSDSIK